MPFEVKMDSGVRQNDDQKRVRHAIRKGGSRRETWVSLLGVHRLLPEGGKPGFPSLAFTATL
jgi:hypothetical protein